MDAAPRIAPFADHSRSPTDGQRPQRFYEAMALVGIAVAVVGFLPTFFMPLALGRFERPPIFYIHAALFFGWTVFFWLQTRLAARGRISAHREWGIAGAVLVTLMCASVLATVVAQLNRQPPIPSGPGSASFAFVQVSGLLIFGGLVGAALANTRRPDLHKRLMLLASLSLLGAPVARWTGVLYPISQPPSALQLLPFLLAPILLMSAPALYDLKTTGRVPRVHVIAVGALAILTFTNVPIGLTPAWLAAADWLKHIGS